MNERERFEAWASKEGWAESDIKDRCALDCPRGDEYRNFGLQDFWEVWQAALRQQGEQEGMVLVPVEKLKHWAEYWNGNENERAMSDALNHILSEIESVIAAKP